MAKSEVKLLGAWPSPFVMRARIALNIKAFEYEFLEPKNQLIFQFNPVYKALVRENCCAFRDNKGF
jgi:glutathione S-transferase